MGIKKTFIFGLFFSLAACDSQKPTAQQATEQKAKQVQTLAKTTTNQQEKNQTQTSDTEQPFAFAMIGDYGNDSDQEKEVSELVNNVFPQFAPEANLFLVTVGDNNYSKLSTNNSTSEEIYASYNASVCESAKGKGEYYKSFMPNGACPNPSIIPTAPERGDACTDYAGNPINMADINLYPAPGNEDVNSSYGENHLKPYTAYFRWARQGCASKQCDSTMINWVKSHYPWVGDDWDCNSVPQNSYDVVRGDYHLFFLDTSWLTDASCNASISGKTTTPEMCYSANDYALLNDQQKQLCGQGYWLEWAAQKNESNPLNNLVFMHHSPFSAGHHGSCPAVQYNFRKMNIGAVYSGHTHVYQRITTDGNNGGDEFYYFINGSGGYSLDQQVCDRNVIIGDPTYTEFNNAESLHTKSVVGYNRKTLQQNKTGYGAMFMAETTSGILESAFYDHRSNSLQDKVDYCQLDFNIENGSAPAKAQGCKSLVQDDYYIESCNPQTNACTTYDTGTGEFVPCL